MPCYRLAEQDFCFFHSIPELEPYAINIEVAEETNLSLSTPPLCFGGDLLSSTISWVSGAQRIVEVYNASSVFLLRIEGGGDFFVGSHGEWVEKVDSADGLNRLDREIILGPGLILALALRNVWSLHASAVMYKENVIVFLGESGQGKSTLASYLTQIEGWHLVADDILPVKIDPSGVSVLPHFPQLKLPMDKQPGVNLPEQLPLNTIVVLEPVNNNQMPELHKLSTPQTVQSLLSHIAGTRMFTPALLTRHLEFSTQAAEQVSAYRMLNPHRRDALPTVRELIEKIC